ncbi:DUF397 domain-containing protein [Kitasatospora sp. NPDC050463]|uniref:DUF397 domain-containing protein n=1 Tax=Kitasatospora sp. NPDC050463 TaxID=3155786 RepID=UPI0033C7E459
MVNTLLTDAGYRPAATRRSSARAAVAVGATKGLGPQPADGTDTSRKVDQRQESEHNGVHAAASSSNQVLLPRLQGSAPRRWKTLSWMRPASCADSNNCPEVAVTADAVHVRSSLQPPAVARLTTDEWRDLVAGVRNGEFDV